MEKGITFVGLDAHKVAINVAMLLPGDGAGGVAVRERDGGGSADGEEGAASRRRARFGSATRRARAVTRCSAGSGSGSWSAWWWRRR